MKLFSSKTIGSMGENAAARYLRHHGYRIVARNVHCGKNELDLIVKNRTDIVFVEVKTRTFETVEATENMPPSLAVNAGKRRRTLDAAFAYLRAHPTHLAPRADVVEVYFEKGRKKPFKIHHIVAAFDAHGSVR